MTLIKVNTDSVSIHESANRFKKIIKVLSLLVSISSIFNESFIKDFLQKSFFTKPQRNNDTVSFHG